MHLALSVFVCLYVCALSCTAIVFIGNLGTEIFKFHRLTLKNIKMKSPVQTYRQRHLAFVVL